MRSLHVQGCSFVSGTPTDVCLIEYNPYNNYPYSGTRYTCIDGSPFQQSWSTATPNNCIGKPTTVKNMTNANIVYNCKNYPDSCDYYIIEHRTFNGSGPQQCIDEYIFWYATNAYAINVCTGTEMRLCTYDNYTIVNYFEDECQFESKNTTTDPILCKVLTDGNGYNETITYCGSS